VNADFYSRENSTSTRKSRQKRKKETNNSTSSVFCLYKDIAKVPSKMRRSSTNKKVEKSLQGGKFKVKKAVVKAKGR
jgi:hypothetical protein